MKTTLILSISAALVACALAQSGPEDFAPTKELPAIKPETWIETINAGPFTFPNKVTISDLKKKIAEYEGKSPEPTLDLSGTAKTAQVSTFTPAPVAAPLPPQIVYLQAPQTSAEAWQTKAIGWIVAVGGVLTAAATVILGFLMRYSGQIKEVKERLTRQDDRQKDTTNAVQALALATPPPVPVNAPVEPQKTDGARVALIAGLLAIVMGATGCAGFQVPANVEGTYDPATGATGGKISGTIHFRDRSGK